MEKGLNKSITQIFFMIIFLIITVFDKVQGIIQPPLSDIWYIVLGLIISGVPIQKIIELLKNNK